jgi:hypothetical protein
LHPTTKKQQARLSANVRRAKANKADMRKTPTVKNAKSPPKQQTSGGDSFFRRLLEKKLGGKPPKTAQQSLPYVEMGKDGICYLGDRLYSKSVAFGDLNYHLAQPDDQTTIFEGYGDLLNFFDASVGGQISAINTPTDKESLNRMIRPPMVHPEFEKITNEFFGFLHDQQTKGNNGMTKVKRATCQIYADNPKAAKQRLERFAADMQNHFKILGAPANPQDGRERLEDCFRILHPDGKQKFRFDWSDLVTSGLSTKDYIAPTSFNFNDARTFRMGEHIGAVSYLQILAPELNDRMLADFLDLESPLTVTIHFRSIEQSEAIKLLKRKLSDIDSMKIAEQKKAVRAGYDMDIIPTDLATYGNEAKTMLEDLQSRNERMFLVSILMLNVAKKKADLETDIFAANAVAQKYNCAFKRLDYQQEQGLMSSLPLGLNQIDIKRGLTTSSVAIFIPFTTCELFQTGEAMYYGLNALSNNLIMADRKRLKNPNGLYLGTPGSGKSFAAKREILNVFLMTEDDIIISDPEAEYFPLVNRLGGQVIKLSPTSTQYINPMDINANYSDEDDPLALKSDFILSLCELIIGGKNGLEPVEKTIIDRCVRLVYRDYLANPETEQMPILEDLYNLLRKQTESEAQRIATALEIYVTGSLNVFNHRTNVDIANRLVCYDIKELGKQLKKLGMLILQDQVWGRVTDNRAQKKTTWFYQDEFHLLLKEEQTAAYSVEIWKRFRKWGGIPTALTQNVKDLLASREIENIFENSDFIYMLNQAQGDRQILAKQLGISPHQLSYVTQANAGEGLMFFGNVIIPFRDNFDKTTEIYSLLTTRPQEAQSI